MKTWRFLLLFLSAFPIIFTITIVSLYLHLQSAKGEGPFYYGDPGITSIHQGYEPAVILSMFLAGYSLFAMCGLLPLYLIIQRKQIEWWLITSCIASFVMGYFAFNTDTMNWILD